MKILSHFLIICLLPAFVTAQIKFEKKSYQEVLKQAKSQNKFVFIFVEPPATIVKPDSLIDIREDMEATGFLNQNFISYSMPYGKEFSELYKKFVVCCTPAQIYLDPDGNMLYKTYGYLTHGKSYLGDLKKAVDKYKNGKSLSGLEAAYKEGNRDTSFLKAYINEKIRLGFTDNSALIEEYGRQITLGKINTIEEARFILKAGPLVNSMLYLIITSNRPLIDSVFNSVPVYERSAINQRISNNTINEAIRLKDANLAKRR